MLKVKIGLYLMVKEYKKREKKDRLIKYYFIYRDVIPHVKILFRI
jgi:hypothetical protein